MLLDDGPAEKTTVADAYKDKPLPLVVSCLRKTSYAGVGEIGDARRRRSGVLGADRLNGLLRAGLRTGGHAGSV